MKHARILSAASSSAFSRTALLSIALAVAGLALAPIPQDGGAPKMDAPNKDAPNKDAPNKDAPNKDAPNKDAPNKDAPKKDDDSGKKSPARQTKEDRDAARAKARWFAQLDRDDKAAIDPLVGFAAPELPESAERIGVDFAKLKDVRGKVVVVQTFTTKVSTGVNALKRAEEAMRASKVASEDLVFLGVHTPEGVDGAKAILEKQKVTLPVVLDKDGAMCDGLGAFRKPIAYVIDRQGNLRYGGLTPEGITNAVKECAAETFNAEIQPKAREIAPTTNAGVKFPTYTLPVTSARDLRGKQAPGFAVERWYNVNDAPSLKGKLTVIDFWATWCGPCVAAIPHMNEIATAYPNDVVCVGVSDESWRNFEDGTLKKRLSKSNFKYAVGIDSQARMKNGFAIQAIPHVAVVSADGIVRWQGHPMNLNPQTMNELVAANRALVSSSGGGAGVANRWQRK